MAAPELRELRARITVETDAALDSVANGKGLDRSEIVREVLHKWALEQITVSSLLLNRLEAEGLAGAPARRESGARKHRAANPSLPLTFEKGNSDG